VWRLEVTVDGLALEEGRGIGGPGAHERTDVEDDAAGEDARGGDDEAGHGVYDVARARVFDRGYEGDESLG